eukprot:5811615-Alexandrium_andersonii.AAC.1
MFSFWMNSSLPLDAEELLPLFSRRGGFGARNPVSRWTCSTLTLPLLLALRSRAVPSAVRSAGLRT